MEEKEESFIESFLYKGKTIKQWEDEAKSIQGVDDSGKPLWYESLANMTDCRTLARLVYETKNKKI